MTFRNCEAISAASEDYYSDFNIGSYIFCDPAEVELWSDSVLPPTPPDSLLDCDPMDHSDVDDQALNQATTSGDWMAEPAQRQVALARTSVQDWRYPPGGSITASDVSAYLDTSKGSVDSGLSPVLSHVSQSTHTLNSLSEPDCPFFSAGLPPAMPQWVVPSQASIPPVLHGHYSKDGSYLVPFMSHEEFRVDALPSASDLPSDVQLVQYPSQNSCQSMFRRNDAHAQTRPLRARTDDPVLQVTRSTSRQQQRVSQPHERGSTISTAFAPIVSNVASYPETSRHMPDLGPANGIASTLAQVPTGSLGPVSVGLNQSTEYQDQSTTYASYIPDFSVEDLSTYFHFDQDEPESQSNVPVPDHSILLSEAQEVVQAPAPSGNVEIDSAGLLPGKVDGLLPGLDVTSSEDNAYGSAGPTTGPNTGNDGDECGHRSHHLYKRGPAEDGLYRCPFAEEENCPHRPTKLKCNYDKFVDSHLKPFKCKVEVCSKLSFSSTACLLRHEREAHGMHGHGERPHECHYAGCERSVPGNGFPRRYNLFDHMKRVHGYKDEGQAGRSADVERRVGGRKRKASSTLPTEPEHQRQKTVPIPRQHVQPVAVAPHAYSNRPIHRIRSGTSSLPSYHSQNRNNGIYHQWSGQHQLLPREATMFPGVEDDVAYQRLSRKLA